jgi:ankyrin repeat protein
MTQQATALPARPSLEFLRKLAKQRLRAMRRTDASAQLAAAQLAVAREHGFASWRQLKAHVDSLAAGSNAAAVAGAAAFLDAAVPRSNEDHRGGNTERAEAMLGADPSLGRSNLYTACALGDADTVAKMLRKDPSLATTPGGPRDWRPLSYLCFSRFLRLRKRPVSGFVRTARLLLDHGADVNTYFLEDPSNPASTKETALYGAAGVAHEPELTKLLLDAGADVNDLVPEGAVGSESLYHASETSDLRCLRLLLERGPRKDNVSYCLARKLDFEDVEGVRLYLEHGADVNYRFGFGDRNARLHHAVIRGRSPAVVELLLENGADVGARNGQGFTAYQLARRYGYTKFAELLLRHGSEPETSDRERFLSACAAGDAETARRIIKENPKDVRSITARDQRILPDAAASGHLKAVELMLSLAFDPDAPGDWGGSALHQAAWSGHADVVELLLKHGARVDTKQHFGGDVLSTAIHGAAHAGHANGVRIVQLLLPRFEGKDLTPYLEQARAHEASDVVRVLESKMTAPQPRPAKVKTSDWKPLMDAALAGDVERARRLLDGGADPNVLSTTPHRYRPPHRAIEHKKTMPKHVGHERVVALLLERGADPKLRATRGLMTALQLAAFGEPRFVPLLRPYFEPLDIFNAAALADEERVAGLLKEDRSLASTGDEAGWQPLHYCAASVMFRQRPELKSALARIARMLIDAGADPMASWMYDGAWPLRPLYFACGASNNDEVARVLLEAGADPCDGESVYHASDEGHAECLALLERSIKPKKLAKEATMCLANQLHWGSTRGMRWLLAHGADPNGLGTMYGDSALHAAARSGASERVVGMLLAHGGDPRVKNREGKDAIQLARAARKARVVKQLEAALKPAPRRNAKAQATRRRARR